MIRATTTLILSICCGWYLTGVMQAGLIVGILLASVVEFIVYRRRAVLRTEQDASRREVMAFIGMHPDGTVEELEALLSADLYGRYTIGKCSQIQPLADAYTERLCKAGNASLADGVPDECQLPVLVLYPQDGEFREECLEGFADRAADAIRTASIKYHTALKLQNGGKNYQADVLVRRN